MMTDAALTELDLERATLYLVADVIEHSRQAHADHVRRIRTVAHRLELELEEAKLRRSIEDPVRAGFVPYDLRDGACDVAPRPLGSSPPQPSDYSLMTRYLELDKCLEQ